MTKFDRFNQFWLFETPLITGISAYELYTDLVKILQYNIDNHNTVQNADDICIF